MNELTGIIQKITTEENISLIVAEVSGINWHALVIDNPDTASYLRQGSNMQLVFKESAVSIAKNVTGLFSIRNRIMCRITDIKEGDVLSVVSLHGNGFTITSVITTYAVKELDLATGDEVEALIKTTDISLMQL